MKVQHLVLDPDVHKALKHWKQTSGKTVKEIGNGALRTAFSMPRRRDLIAQVLIESGKIDREDFERARGVAAAAVKPGYQQASTMTRTDAQGHVMAVGSWAGQLIALGEGGAYQAFVHWARDAKKIPTPYHVHGYSDTWAFMLRGRVLLRTDKDERIVRRDDTVHVPPGTPHSTVPLSRDARVLIVFSPADSEDHH